MKKSFYRYAFMVVYFSSEISNASNGISNAYLILNLTLSYHR